MRVVVTGAGNPVGQAIVAALLQRGHSVRLFAVPEEVAAGFEGQGALTWHPGDVKVAGSIEPVLSEREVLVHAACLDPPGRDRDAHVRHIVEGTLFARYGAEREQVDHFIHVAPARPERSFRAAHAQAVAAAAATRGVIHAKVVEAASPLEAAREVLAALEEGGRLGKQPGREQDAVTV